MKIFVAGATGALGRALVPQLVERGHEVVGMTRSAAKQDLVRSLGARPVVADALDPDAVAQAVASAEPEVIVHQLTALSGRLRQRHIDRSFATDEPAAHGGHRPPARRRPRRRRAALRGAELRGLAGRTHRRTREERGRPSIPTRRRRCRGAGGHPPPRGGGDRRRTGAGHRAALRRVLRPRHHAQRRPRPPRTAGRSASASSRGRRRRRRLVVHPHRGRRGGDRGRGRAGRARHLQRGRRRPRPGAGLDAGAGPRAGRQAAAACARAGSAGCWPARRRPS